MAKDPAVLWYWNDWHGGTCTFSRFLKGCYMDLLHAQFNSGNLSIEEIKTVLGSDFGSAWPTLQKKFKQDDTGLFFNERLVTESVKRRSYTKGRRENLIDNIEMFSHMEDEIENEFRDVFVKWLMYRKTRREKYKDEKTIKIAYDKLFKISEGNVELAEEIINDAMANNYSGFFKLKTTEKKETKRNTVEAMLKTHNSVQNMIDNDPQYQ